MFNTISKHSVLIAVSVSTSILKCAIKSCLISHMSGYLCASSDAQSMKTSVQSPLLPSSVNEVSGLMSCANHVSVMMFQPWDAGPKWSQIATHPWPIHKVIGDKGLCPWSTAYVAETMCKIVGPSLSLVTGPFPPVSFLLSSKVLQQLSQVTPAHTHSVMIFISKIYTKQKQVVVIT